MKYRTRLTMSSTTSSDGRRRKSNAARCRKPFVSVIRNDALPMCTSRVAICRRQHPSYLIRFRRECVIKCSKEVPIGGACACFCTHWNVSDESPEYNRVSRRVVFAGVALTVRLDWRELGAWRDDVVEIVLYKIQTDANSSSLIGEVYGLFRFAVGNCNAYESGIMTMGRR